MRALNDEELKEYEKSIKYLGLNKSPIEHLMKNAIPIEKGKQISKEYNKQLRKLKNTKILIVSQKGKY